MKGDLMAQQDVEATRAAYEAFGRGDVQEAAKDFADDIEWWTSDSLPDGGLIRGKDAMLEAWSNIPNYFTEFTVEPDELMDCGDKVIVRGHQHVKTKDTGESYEGPFVHILEFSDGKVQRAEFYEDSGKVLEALAGQNIEVGAA
jgi:ketosteroid isomerase-like protein